MVAQVLLEAEAPMGVADIHEGVQARLGDIRAAEHGQGVPGGACSP